MIVTVAFPRAAVELAVRVSTVALVAGLVPKDAVTPVGNPLAASVTFPVKPPKSPIAMLSVIFAP